MTLPDISIITSLYRSERYFKRYVRAVIEVAEQLKNAGLSLELILVSNDPTPGEDKALNQLVRALNKKELASPSLMIVPRESLYASWNRGVKSARANCVGFWNVDDIRNSEALSEGVEVIRNGAQLIYFPYIYMIYRNRGLFRNLSVSFKFPEVPSFSRFDFTRRMLVGPFFLFSRTFYDHIGPFDEQFRIVGDFDWSIRAAKETDFHLGRSIAGVFTQDGHGLTARGNPRHTAENNIVYMRHGVLDKIEPVDDVLMKQYQVDFKIEHSSNEDITKPLVSIYTATNDADLWDRKWEQQQQILRAIQRIKRIPQKIKRVIHRVFVK
jgi:glycosyltransferase involved in cell wall biosynthesis